MMVRTYVYTPGIDAEGYIVFVFPLSIHLFACSYVCMFVPQLLSVTFVQFTSEFSVEDSLSGYIYPTTHQKAFIFRPWVP